MKIIEQEKEFLESVSEAEKENGKFSVEINNRLEKIRKIEEEEKAFKIKAILSGKRKKFQGVGAGIHDGVFYFGTNFYIGDKDKTAVITSDKEIFIDWGKEKNEIKNNFGLNYRFDFFGDLLTFDWSYESIKEFLYGTPKNLGIKRCHELILEKQKQFMWHYEKGYYETIACEIQATYYHSIFSSMGRKFFNAEYESGKTQQSNMFSGLAFHPLSSGNMSGASVYRCIESVKPTLIIDDYDKIPEEQKIAFDQTLRVGYKKGMKAIRADDKRPIGFDLYSPMIINNVGGLDEISESRCTKHVLMKCAKNFNPQNLENIVYEWTNERDALYTSAMLNWKEVKAVYDEIDVPELSQRALERDKATLTIAKIAGCYDKVLSYLIKNNTARTITAVEDDWLFQIIKWWKGLSEDNELPKEFSAGEIANEIWGVCLTIEPEDRNFNKEKHKLSWHIGKFLSKYPIIEARILRGEKKYKLTAETLYRVASAKNYNEILELNPPTKPSTPTPLSTPQTEGNNGGEGELGGLEIKPAINLDYCFSGRCIVCDEIKENLNDNKKCRECDCN